MKSESFESFRVTNLRRILGGATIYCKNAAGENLGTIEDHDCGGAVTALSACINAYPTAEQSAGPC